MNSGARVPLEPTLEQRMSAYLADYPQDVRDLAETFCSATTRLKGQQGRTTPELSADIRSTAMARGIPVDVLRSAVDAFSRIEAEAEAQHRNRKPR